MKTYKLISCFLLVLATAWVLQSCKDNILKPVVDNKSADSLTALINGLNTKLITINAKDNSVNIQLLKFQTKRDSLNAVSPSNDEYGQNVEYTVYIEDGSTTVSGTGDNGGIGGRKACKDCRVTGVDGATVTALSNGQVYTATSADGRAIFGGLKIAGLVTVNVSATGYAGVSFITYFNPDNNSASQTGSTISASTNIMMLPTAGANVTTFTGQIYANKSSLDDTLGRIHNDASAAATYLKFVSAYGPYHGGNYGASGESLYGYSDIRTGIYGFPSGQSIKFDNVTSLSGLKYIYAFPANISAYYPAYDLNYNDLPGDIISITYTGLTSFASIDATGKYTLVVPSYANSPGTIIGTTSSDAWAGYNNKISYQDSVTWISTSQYPTSKAIANLKTYDVNTSIATPATYYKVTEFFDYYPYIELDDNNGYGDISGNDATNGTFQYFNGLPGQTYNRNVFLFPWHNVR